MAAGKTIEGTNPLGEDKAPGGDSDAPDVKKYIQFLVTSTKHLFTAPKDKYKDVGTALGIVETTDTNKKGARKLKRGTGFLQIAVTLEGGATLRLACDPDKIGSIDDAIGKNVYGVKVKNVYIPKTQATR